MKKVLLFLLLYCGVASSCSSQNKDENSNQGLPSSYSLRVPDVLKNIKQVWILSDKTYYTLEMATEQGAIPAGEQRLKATYLFLYGEQTPYFLLVESLGLTRDERKVHIAKREFDEEGNFTILEPYTLKYRVSDEGGAAYVTEKKDHMDRKKYIVGFNLSLTSAYLIDYDSSIHFYVD